MRRYAADGLIKVEPFDESLVQPSSLDVRLGEGLRVLVAGEEPIDPMERIDYSVPISFQLGATFILHPGDFVLAQTMERIHLPDEVAAKVEGKSSLGRLGLLLHATAGFIDPGFEGTITLELSLTSPRALVLRPGMKIGQLCFFQLTSPAVKPYGSVGLGSKYQGQDGPTPSRYFDSPVTS